MKRIDKLFDNNKLKSSQKNLLHNARMARNDWIHKGKSPDHKILEQLLDFLAKHEVQPKL